MFYLYGHSMYVSHIAMIWLWYIYIYCHTLTNCFVVSQLFSVARQIGILKLGSKPAQLYVRLSIIPLRQQANHVRYVLKIIYCNIGIYEGWLVVFFCFFSISTLVSYLLPNPFYTNNQFYFKQFSLPKVHSLIVKNISISSYSL